MLDDREQRLLYEIEHALADEDPQLAALLAGTARPSRSRIRRGLGWFTLAAALPAALCFVDLELAFLAGCVMLITPALVSLIRYQ
jgi:hypothetical protein